MSQNDGPASVVPNCGSRLVKKTAIFGLARLLTRPCRRASRGSPFGEEVAERIHSLLKWIGVARAGIRIIPIPSNPFRALLRVLLEKILEHVPRPR